MALLQGLLQLCAFILKVCMMVSKKSKIVCQSFGHKNILRFCRYMAFWLNSIKQLQKLVILAWLQMIVQSLVSQ